MSLAMFAAPFNDIENSTSNSDNMINKKRLAHTKTQKMYPKEAFNTDKVNSVLEKIHNNNDEEEDDEDTFTPPPKPESAGVNKTKQLPQREPMTNYTPSNEVTFKTLGKAPSPNYDGGNNLDLNNYTNYGNDDTNNEYYKRVMPNYNSTAKPSSVGNKPYYNNYNTNTNNTESSQDVLLQKLNYMITLLEDQQDERTNNVTEEVVLYSFLGIFIIFIADTFVRTGKYVR